MDKIHRAGIRTGASHRLGHVLTCAALAAAVFAGGLLAVAAPASAQAAADGSVAFTGQTPVAAGEFNGDLSKIPFSPSMVGSPKIYRPRLAGPQVSKDPGSGTTAAPAALPVGPAAPMPGTIQNFAGMSLADMCTGGQCGTGFPPDTNGDVGPNHYIQQVNGSVAIYTKTGTLLTAFTEDTLWSGVGSTPCNGNSYGDPITLYDWLADRFVLTWFAFGTSGGNPVAPFYQCIAASKTADPVAGGWWLYAVQMDTGGVGQPPAGNLNDYFKLGMWNDCMYYAANGFQAPTFAYTGVQVAWFNRTQMYAGAAMQLYAGLSSLRPWDRGRRLHSDSEQQQREGRERRAGGYAQLFRVGVELRLCLHRPAGYARPELLQAARSAPPSPSRRTPMTSTCSTSRSPTPQRRSTTSATA